MGLRIICMNKFLEICLMAMVLTFALSSCASAPSSTSGTIPPGFLYRGDFLNIRSPNEKGWRPVAVSHTSMIFTHRGVEKGESFGAQVLTLPVPGMDNAQQLLNYIKKSFKAELNRKKYAVVKSKFHVTKTRKYPCVRVSMVIQNKRVLKAASEHKKLLVQSISLYCRHPVQKSAVFAAIYSHRGTSLDPGLSKKADDFINGVQVPGY
jgi:hypothetical protein